MKVDLSDQFQIPVKNLVSDVCRIWDWKRYTTFSIFCGNIGLTIIVTIYLSCDCNNS
jgi:hypothetical protein